MFRFDFETLFLKDKCMLKTRWPLVLAVVSFTGVIVVAGQAVSAGEKSPPQRPLRIQKASDLIGKSVQNTRGEPLGKVHDLAIDAEHGRVAYAVLSFGGFLGMGDKWFAVPTGALTLPADCKQFVLAVDKDRLKGATGFDKDRWPKMDDPSWSTKVHEFYGQRPYWMNEGEGSTPTDARIQKASDIIGRAVQNDRGEELGQIQDLVIDPDRNRVSYVVMTFGGFMGLGEKLFAIPAGVLKMPGTGGYAVLSVEKEQLKNAAGFDKDKWPNLADPTTASGIYEFYGAKPYWVEDLRGGEYLASAAGKNCDQCGATTVAQGFVRDGQVCCCAGCANKTGCTCRAVSAKVRP
jgi:sporulation protein YlmC with PRC-barrel domain